MALLNEHSNPPLLGGGLGEKRKVTQNDGEYQSSGNDTLNESVDPVDLEEGEILESGEEESKETVRAYSEEKSAPPKLKAKKKKKKKRKPLSEVEKDIQPKKAVKKTYIDYDKVNESDEEFLNIEYAGGKKLRQRHSSFSANEADDYLSSPKKSNDGKWENNNHSGCHGSPLFDNAYDSYENEQNNSDSDEQSSDRKHKSEPPSKKRKSDVSRRSERKRKRKAPIESKSRGLICKFYLDGKCLKGHECTYRHDEDRPRRRELCKFYLNGFCRSGDTCMFMHHEYPCKFFHTGAKCYSNENCRFSHSPLNEETTKLLEKCLDSGRLPSDRRVGNNETSPKSQSDGSTRPSLLGSPPRLLEKRSDSSRAPPSLMSLNPPEFMPRPNFYIETGIEDRCGDLDGGGDRTPVNSEGQGNSWDGEKSCEVENDADVSTKDQEVIQDDPQDSSDHLDDAQKFPAHLPKKQRELFLRIQHHQREVEGQNDGHSQSEDKEEDENWYSDEDDEGDQPLTAVLKQLQQVPNETEKNRGNPVAPVLDIASMISAIRNQKSMKNGGGDNVSKISANETRSESRDLRYPNSAAVDYALPQSDPRSSTTNPGSYTPPQCDARDPRLAKDPRNKSDAKPSKTLFPEEYSLTKIDASSPGDYNRYAIASENDSSLEKDPRIKKVIDKYGGIESIIKEEERKLIPKLPDFVPPPSSGGQLELQLESKLLPNYTKAIDPRTGRRPPLLPAPDSNAIANSGPGLMGPCPSGFQPLSINDFSGLPSLNRSLSMPNQSGSTNGKNEFGLGFPDGIMNQIDVRMPGSPEHFNPKFPVSSNMLMVRDQRTLDASSQMSSNRDPRKKDINSSDQQIYLRKVVSDPAAIRDPRRRGNVPADSVQPIQRMFKDDPTASPFC